MRRWPGLAGMLLAASAAQGAGADCEALRAAIQARIRAHGVADAVVAIEDAGATPRGKVVGQCELGTKRLVQLAAPPARPASSAASAPPRSRVITECDDGRTVTPGPCKR